MIINGLWPTCLRIAMSLEAFSPNNRAEGSQTRRCFMHSMSHWPQLTRCFRAGPAPHQCSVQDKIKLHIVCLTMSRPTQWVRGGELFQFSVWYAGVTTVTQEARLKTELYLEFSEITKDGNFATL